MIHRAIQRREYVGAVHGFVSLLGAIDPAGVMQQRARRVFRVALRSERRNCSMTTNDSMATHHE